MRFTPMSQSRNTMGAFTSMRQSKNTMGFLSGLPVYSGTDWINMGPDNRRYKTGDELNVAQVADILASLTPAQATQLANQDAAFAATGYIGPIAPPGNPPVTVNIPASAYGTQIADVVVGVPAISSATLPLYTAAQWVNMGPAMRNAIRPTLTNEQAQAIWQLMSPMQQMQVGQANAAWEAQTGTPDAPVGSGLTNAPAPTVGSTLLKYGALAFAALSLLK